MKLAHRFTGAEVLMRTGDKAGDGHARSRARQACPTMAPCPTTGATTRAYSFTGEAFPSGPLQISLLVASRRAIEG